MYERSYGNRYEDGLDVAEIARRVRAEFKAAVKAGELPAGAKVSVTIARFSGGRSIRAAIVEVPGGTISPEYTEWIEANPAEAHYPPIWVSRTRYTNDVRRVAEWLERALWAFNHDGSEMQVDYWDVNFYASVVAPDGYSVGNGVKSDETLEREEAEFYKVDSNRHDAVESSA